MTECYALARTVIPEGVLAGELVAALLVFDGHGGSLVSAVLQNTFVMRLQESLNTLPPEAAEVDE